MDGLVDDLSEIGQPRSASITAASEPAHFSFATPLPRRPPSLQSLLRDETLLRLFPVGVHKIGTLIIRPFRFSSLSGQSRQTN